MIRNRHLEPLVPAKAGTQFFDEGLDARFRGHERRMVLSAIILLLAAGLFAASPCVAQDAIPFAPLQDNAIKDPDNPTKTFRVDFARVEAEFPITRRQLDRLTPADIAAFRQEEVDQIYGRLTAGTLPDGPYLGGFFFARGDDGRARLEEILGGIRGRVAGAGVSLLQSIGNDLWRGKVFYRDQRIARTMIQDRAAIRRLIDNPDTVMRMPVPDESWLERLFPKQAWLLFPAKVHCGQSLLDARRESIVIDHNFNDEIEGYRASPDSLAGRGGLHLRDEIRMIRPGFYLGRVYANRVFVANFTLYNLQVADSSEDAFLAGGPVQEDCWIGEQTRKAP
jgi:hypothetical protein